MASRDSERDNPIPLPSPLQSHPPDFPTDSHADADPAPVSPISSIFSQCLQFQPGRDSEQALGWSAPVPRQRPSAHDHSHRFHSSIHLQRQLERSPHMSRGPASESSAASATSPNGKRPETRLSATCCSRRATYCRPFPSSKRGSSRVLSRSSTSRAQCQFLRSSV